jgi:general secretion pathway protein E
LNPYNAWQPESARTRREELGQILVKENLITAAQLETAFRLQKQQGKKLSSILVNNGLIKAEDLAVALSIHLNMPLIDLRRHVIQADALRLIPEETARRHILIPMDIINDALIVVMADPEDIQAIEDIKAQAKIRVEVALGIPADIERAIDLNYRSNAEIKKQVDQLRPIIKDIETPPSPAMKTPIAETLDLLIAQAVKNRASDIHVEPQDNRLRIRFRMFTFPIATHGQLISRVKILAGMNIAEQRHPQDGQFNFKLGSKEIDIRVATMETPYGERAALRILDKSLSLFTLPELGFLPDTLKRYNKMLKSPIGMILVSGPTGSGKTTTLYASVNQLDRNELNIMTIEDPIEYHFMDINQTQVNTKAGITFAGGLRAIMRHDPDVILVGEIRDKDTAITAVQAALTGHLVLSSIHANDAVGALFRLMDLGIEPSLISATLIGVLAQRMARRVCTGCRTHFELSAEEMAAYSEEIERPPEEFLKGAGCNLCVDTGFRGRIGIFELLVMNDKIGMMLRGGTSPAEIKAQALAEGMATMKHDAMLKAEKGITTVSEVLRSVFSVI